MKAKQLTLIPNMTTGIASCISIATGIAISIVGCIGIVGIVSILSAVNGTNVSALTYQSTINPEFTINPAISVSLSSADLIISDLAPGQSADSNIITVNVATNNEIGYNLSATVGNNVDSNPSHNTTNLVHSNGNYTFTSLSTNDSLSALTTPDTWGYSYATTTLDDGNSNTVWNWSNYSGLPLYTDTTRVATLSEKYVASNDTIGFKIAAYADSDQAAGEYTNKINFLAVAFPSPITLSEAYAYFNKSQIGGYYTMQDMEPGICAVAEQLSTMQVIDTRDHNIYTIAKLADNRCWMTTNLNLEGGTELSSSDTDMPSTWTLPTANGFQTGNRLPASSTSGFSDNAVASLYNSNNTTCDGNSPCHSYYSWTTATLGSGLAIVSDNADAPYSVCPKSWHLPNTRNGTDLESDYRALMVALSGGPNPTAFTASTDPTGAAMYSILINSTYNFLITNYYQNSAFGTGYFGEYWTSTVAYNADTHARYFFLDPTRVYPANVSNRNSGFSIRCIANN